MHEWHIIFYIGASVYIASAVIFCIFGSASIQPFNDEQQEKNRIENAVGMENPAFEINETTKC